MDLFEIRNWFAHKLCHFLSEGDEEELQLLKTVVEAVLRGESAAPKELLSQLSQEFPLIKAEGEKVYLKKEELDPFTSEYLREKAALYDAFLRELPPDFQPTLGELKRSVETARMLFKAKLFFEVHELLEEVWMGEFGKYRDLLQALIQVGVAYYHLNNFNRRGFQLLLENALELLSGYSGEVLTVKVDELKEQLKRARETEELVAF